MATILAEEHGDDFAKNPLPISITMMTIERGKQGGNAQIW
jgi:hypothetical protein